MAQVDAPVVSFASPIDKQRINAPASMVVDVNARSNKGVSKVKLYLNGELVGKKGKHPIRGRKAAHYYVI